MEHFKIGEDDPSASEYASVSRDMITLKNNRDSSENDFSEGYPDTATVPESDCA